jgi:putative N6-adenine-specific DNA methylase
MTFDLFAVTAPGLSPLTLAELKSLGIDGKATPAGVEFRGDLETVGRANLWLRTATRVLVRLGEVKATAFPELIRKAAALPWGKFIPPNSRVHVKATCRKSRLYHSGGVAERLLTALQSQVRGVAAAEDGQQILARFDHDVCTISIDSSGDLLHMRGWRGPQAKAPLRETLAAALLLAAQYDGSQPLCDPLCGSGTIAIEGALIAQNLAPGLQRSFAFEKWPGFSQQRFQQLKDQSKQQQRPLAQPIEASDQDLGAIRATRENAAKAGVQIVAKQRRLIDLPEDQGEGLIACNPPYGVRIAAGDVWRDLREAQRKRPKWRCAAIVADEQASGFQRILKTENGGLPVSLSLVI